MNTIYTIGYEGTDIDRFIATLKMVGVTMVADIRAVALSRKKGFSKTALKSRLEDEGLSYVHFIDLGDPKLGRIAAKAGNYAEFRKIYNAHLSERKSVEALERLEEVARNSVTCLLCFERDYTTCHRSIVADNLALQGMDVFNLYGDFPRRYVDFTEKQSRSYISQSAAAA